MKKMICFVLISFLGVMFSLGNASKELELTSVNAEGMVTYVRFHAFVEENHVTTYELQWHMQAIVEHYTLSLHQLGYRIGGYPFAWKYENLYGNTWCYCDFVLSNEDAEYSELVIRNIVRDLGRELKRRLNIGLFAEIENQIFEF